MRHRVAEDPIVDFVRLKALMDGGSDGAHLIHELLPPRWFQREQLASSGL